MSRLGGNTFELIEESQSLKEFSINGFKWIEKVAMARIEQPEKIVKVLYYSKNQERLRSRPCGVVLLDGYTIPVKWTETKMSFDPMRGACSLEHSCGDAVEILRFEDNPKEKVPFKILIDGLGEITKEGMEWCQKVGVNENYIEFILKKAIEP
jgi:hypothetical protein